MTNLRKYFLPHTAVLVECLDSNKQEIQTATASGFIRQENERFFLYTCWHAVTGLHPDRISIERDFMQRRYLRVSLQSFRDEGALKVIGGLRSFVVPLYEESDSTSRPLWYQVIRHTPHAGLNSIGLFVPCSKDRNLPRSAVRRVSGNNE